MFAHVKRTPMFAHVCVFLLLRMAFDIQLQARCRLDGHAPKLLVVSTPACTTRGHTGHSHIDYATGSRNRAAPSHTWCPRPSTGPAHGPACEMTVCPHPLLLSAGVVEYRPARRAVTHRPGRHGHQHGASLASQAAVLFGWQSPTAARGCILCWVDLLPSSRTCEVPWAAC